NSWDETRASLLSSAINLPGVEQLWLRGEIEDLFRKEFGQIVDHVLDRQHPHWTVRLIDQRQVPEAPFAHQVEGKGGGGLYRQHFRISRQYRGYGCQGGVLATPCHFVQHVAFGKDADQAVRLLYQHTPHMLRLHQADRLGDARRASDTERGGER